MIEPRKYMTVRQLTPDELPLCVPLGQAFHVEGKLPGAFIDHVFLASWTKLMQGWIGAVFGAFAPEGNMVGMIGGMRYQDLNDGQWVSMEAFWYVLPEHRKGRTGLALLKSYEAWAKKTGAVRIGVASLNGLNADKMANLYRAWGYRALDRTYIKEAA